MKYELEIILVVEKKGNGKTKPIRKTIKNKKLFDLEKVELEEFNDYKTGEPSKKYSGVYYNDVYYKVNKPYEELKELILNKTIPILGLANKIRHGNKNTKKF